MVRPFSICFVIALEVSGATGMAAVTVKLYGVAGSFARCAAIFAVL